VSKLVLTGVLSACLAASTPAVAAPFIEIGDAGNLPGTANTTDVVGPLTAILGNLSAPDPFDALLDVDMFRIYISDPGAFSASTVNSPGLLVDDPQLFLFNSAGIGVFMNDDDPSGLNGAQSALGPLPLGFLQGVYVLAIGWWDNEPVSAIDDLIFDPVLGVSPDPVAGWNNDVLQRVDSPTGYQIDLTGALPATAVPEPATITMTALGLAGVLLRPRRQSTRRRPSDLTTRD
jgi:hypothetical protein